MSTDGNDTSAPRSVPGPVPLSVPDFVAGPVDGAPPPGVTDEERNRYGVLLDHAAERGLLAPAEYQARLTELADATSVEELQRIVTELPAFAAAGAPASSPHRTSPSSAGRSSAGRSSGSATTSTGDGPAALDAVLWASSTPARARRTSGNPWLVLCVVLFVLVVALVALALVAGHVVHTHHAGSAGAGPAVLSRLRL